MGCGGRTLAGAAALACAALLASGCGGASRRASAARDARSGSAAVPAPGASSYRWLVPTQGAPPAVADENRARGTSAWRLPGPRSLLGGAARGAIAGYVARQSLAAGERQTIYVNAPGAHRVAVSVYRMGWYRGLGGRLVLQSALLPAVRQPPCAHVARTGLTECRWHPTLSFPIPPALVSGVYIAKLDATDGARADCIFVVRARRAARLLVEIPTASWEAYNEWGGDSLYAGGKPVGVSAGTQGVEVSYDRPYASQTGAGQFFIREVAIVRFLERHGYPASYTTIDSIDQDPAQVAHARALLDAGHSEYWSARAAAAFQRARDRGTSLLFISSDTMAWRVRFATATRASSEAGAPAHRIISYKQYAVRDPDRAAPSGLFPLGGASLVGSAYDGCITPRQPHSSPPVYRYYAWAPAPGLRPHWLFAHTGVSAATRIPGIVGYEFDETTPATPRAAIVLGAGYGACGLSAESSPTRGTLAQSTVYEARSGALVFATGTLGWLYGLSPVPQASPDAPRRPDGRVVAMTHNVLARALRGR